MKKYAFLPVVGLALTLLWCGCQTSKPDPAYIRDGRQYGVYDGLWRARWWSYYGRGLSFVEGEFWDEAVQDLQKSIELRGMVVREVADQYLARTYGTHFVDFFPHRELGVVYYSQGKYDDAIRELDMSRSETDTAKARHFLDLARAALLSQTGADQTAPELDIDPLSVPEATTAFEMRITGRARDDTYVAAISVGRQLVRIPIAEPTVEFDVTVPVERGTNMIVVEAIDLLGHTTSTTISIEGDHEGPALTIVSPNLLVPATASRIVLRGFVQDRSGVTSLRIGDDEVALSFVDGLDGVFAFEHNVSLQAGPNPILFECTDTLDNITRGVVTIYSQLQQAWRSEGTPIVYASYRQETLVPAGAIETADLMLQVNRQTADGVAEIPEPWHAYGPTAKIVAGIFTAREATVTIESGTDQPIEDTVPAGMTMRTYTLKLAQGENLVRVEASSGDSVQTHEMTIIRHPVGIDNMAWRLQVAVLPPGCSVERAAPPQSSPLIRTLFQQALFDWERFNIIERDRLDAVLLEQDLSLAGLTDPRSAIRVGAMVAAEALIITDVRETDKDVQVIQRVVDTETSLILAMKDAYCENKEYDTIRIRLSELVQDICREFPLIEGQVVRTEGKEVFVDLGSDHGLRKGSRLNVVERGDPIVDERTGEVLLEASPERVGAIRVEEAFPAVSRTVQYYAVDNAPEIQPGLEAWTK